MPYIGSSRYKYSPYLTIHFGKTEQFVAGDAVVPWDPLLNPDDPCAFDNYMEYLGIHYWWKMQGTYTAVGQSEDNAGTGGAMPLYARRSVTSLFSNQPPLVQKTCDGKSITKGSNLNNSEADILVDGTENFTMGGWFKTTSLIIDSTGLFKTNAGIGGYRSGIHVRPLSSGSNAYLTVSPSRGAAGTNKAYTTAVGTYPFNAIHFVVLRVQPTQNTATTSLELFIDGEKKTLTDTGNPDHSINWNTTISNGFGETPGIYYSSGDGQSNGSVGGGYDELFFHWGLLTDQQILELYNRGKA